MVLSANVKKSIFVDEISMMPDEFLFFSVQVSWEFQGRFPIFIPKSPLSGGFHPLIRKQTNLFL